MHDQRRLDEETTEDRLSTDDDAPLELFGQAEVESFRDEWCDIQLLNA